jgi:hypothetical protein
MLSFRENKTKYRKTKIRLSQVEDSVWGDTHVVVVKFVETKESDEIEKQHSLYQENEELHQGVERVKERDSKEIKNKELIDAKNLEAEMEKSEKSSNISGYMILPIFF